MSVVVQAIFKSKDDQYQALYDMMVAILPDTAARDGAELISAAADSENKTIIVHEVWDTIASQKAYLNWRVERGDVDKLIPLLREPPQFIEMDHLTF